MAVAEHSDNIELQDIDDTSYDDIDARPAAQERDPLQEEDSQISEDASYYDIDAEDGLYEQLDVQQIRDATYEDVATQLRKILKSGKRCY